MSQERRIWIISENEKCFRETRADYSTAPARAQRHPLVGTGNTCEGDVLAVCCCVTIHKNAAALNDHDLLFLMVLQLGQT